MSLFTECFGAEAGCDAQSGCGIASLGQPIMEEFKKSLLEAGSSVIKKLRKRKQVGKGKQKKKKVQKGAGLRKKGQKGAGLKKRNNKKPRQQGRGIKRKGRKRK